MTAPRTPATIWSVRERIDAIDRELLRLISERARCAQEVGHIKSNSATGPEGRGQFYRPGAGGGHPAPHQGAQSGPLGDEEVARLFREIMSACLALERPLRVAYLGPEGTFTQAAALKHFGHSVHSAHGRASATSSARWRPAPVTTGWCRWRIPPRGSSATPWTSS
jgi:chorismate mutase / prephenate dehydratase